jgi:type III secretion protein O
VLKDLLKIKQHRETNAENAVARQRRLLEERIADVQRAREEAARFHTERVRREQALFDDLKGRTVGLRDLEDMKRAVSALREKEASMEARIIDAQNQVEKEEQRLEEARQEHRDTMREVAKFKELLEAHVAAEGKEQARKEENETEEILTAAYHPGARGE